MKSLRGMSFAVLMILLICTIIGSSHAAIRVDGPYIDTTTQGDWTKKYMQGGSCFYLLPESPERDKEFNIDTTSPSPFCFGGSLVTDEKLVWDLFAYPANPIYAWYFDPNASWTETRPVGSSHPADQWNPCRNEFYGSTFDNGDLDSSRGIFEPLVSEVTVNFTGSFRIAYYFLEEYINHCREQEYKLFVNGIFYKKGLVRDFDTGKYVVFNISGLEGTSTIRLEVTNTLGTPCGTGEATYPNVHFSGIFIDKCTACPGTGTPGYWKNHPEAWPVDSITIGGVNYTKAEAIALIKCSTSGNKLFTMFPALIAAKLNVLRGCGGTCIDGTIDAADEWFITYALDGMPSTCDGTPIINSSSYAWKVGEPLYWKLDEYNNGQLYVNGALCAPSR